MRVSVLVTNYGNLPYLQEAVDSLYGQTRPADEVLIVDDGFERPPDLDLPAGWRYLKLEHRGIGATLNRGISMLSGDVICWLPSDDLFLPRKIERQLTFAEENPGCVLHSFCEVWDGQDFSRLGRVPDLTDEEMGSVIRTSCPYYANTFMIPREVLEKVGPFREDVPASEDYEWVLRSVIEHGVRYRLQKEVLTVKRKHGESNTSRYGHLIADLTRKFNEEHR